MGTTNSGTHFKTGNLTPVVTRVLLVVHVGLETGFLSKAPLIFILFLNFLKNCVLTLVKI